MDLSTFLDNWLLPDKSRFVPLICFYGVEETPILFFAYLIHAARIRTLYTVECLDLRDVSFEECKPRLQSSFLGNRVVYWLNGLLTLSSTEQARIYTWLAQYQGPHTLVFFSGKQCVNEQKYGVQLPEYVDKTLWIALLHVSIQSQEQGSKTLLTCVTKMQRISLEKACLLLHYSRVMGRIDQASMQEWVETIITPEVSLFALSKTFLAKEEQLFFTSWSKVHLLYPSSFWVAFWSEQLWRAALYAYCMKASRLNEAKALSGRLPFAFLQSGWNEACPQELKNAHTFIYQLDSSLKRGGHEYFLDLMYLKFFAGNFAGSASL